MLGRQPTDKPAGFGQKRFEAFRKRHLDFEQSVSEPFFSTVCRFLQQWSPANLVNHPLLNEIGTGFGVFQIVGQAQPVQDAEAIRSWWRNNLPKETNGK